MSPGDAKGSKNSTSSSRADDQQNADSLARTEAVERAISMAASLICDAHLNGYQLGMLVKGATCEIFPVHHSLPHRTRMLEALALLNIDGSGAGQATRNPASRNASSHGMSRGTMPTVAVTVGEAHTSPQRYVALSASHMDEFVREAEGGSKALLQRWTRATAAPTTSKAGRFGERNLTDDNGTGNVTANNAGGENPDSELVTQEASR